MLEDDFLGSINAEKDQYLLECAIENISAFENKHILTGRWGVGKSALLILKNKNVVQILENVDTPQDIQKLRLCWYAGEDTLDYDILRAIESEFIGDRKIFLISAYEKLWQLEILRTYCVTLGNLNKYYFYYNTPHWNEITWLAENSRFKLTNVWKNIGIINQVLKITLPYKITDIYNSDKTLDTDEKTLFANVAKCLADLSKGNETWMPIIAIEPIETYNSKIENENSLAQNLIESLLNVFSTKFSPSVYSNFDVRLSIPWHRLSNTDSKFIHKLADDIGVVKWTKKRLKEFINRRILNAYKKAGIQIRVDKNLDAWYLLFEKSIPYVPITAHSAIPTNEDSFEYFLRHTHYRPRDILQLVKYCIASIIDDRDDLSSERDVFISGEKIPHKLIKDTFRDKGEEIGNILIKEGKRKYKNLGTLSNSLQGMKVPISEQELRKVLAAQSKFTFEESVPILWDCGILGISVNTNNDFIKKILEAKYTTLLNRVYIEAKTNRWFWFQHLCKDDNINMIINFLNPIKNDVPSFEWNFIVHPKMYEFLNIRPSDFVPLGI